MIDEGSLELAPDFQRGKVWKAEQKSRLVESLFTLRPLTVLTGLNGAGKSTVIQALLLARQAAASPSAETIALNGPYGLALGEAQELLHPSAERPGVRCRAAGRNSLYALAVPLRHPWRARPAPDG